MKRLSRWLARLVWLLAAVVGFLFAYDNAETVEVSLLGYSFGHWRLGLWLLVFTFIGVLLGLLATVASAATDKRRLASLRRQNAALEKRLESLQRSNLPH